MTFDFTEDQLALRDLVRKFVEREMPKDAVAEWDAKGAFPDGLLDRMAAIRGGSVCLNRFRAFLEWISALIMLRPEPATAG